MMGFLFYFSATGTERAFLAPSLYLCFAPSHASPPHGVYLPPAPCLLLSGSCKRSPYHYAAECEDVVRLAREWAFWLTEGKATFLRAVAAQDDQHKALLMKHERRKNKHDRAVQEASGFVYVVPESVG